MVQKEIAIAKLFCAPEFWATVSSSGLLDTIIAALPRMRPSATRWKSWRVATPSSSPLLVILVELEDLKKFYADYQKHFQAAADKGLVELSVIESAKV